MHTKNDRRRRRRLAAVAVLAVALASIAGPPARAETNTWSALAREAFAGRPLADGAAFLGLDMPYRAANASIVPVTLRVALPPGDGRSVKAVTLVIDENPAPVAATFSLGPNDGTATLATRVRVNSYTDVHAVAELSDGTLHAVATHVKASGGCSAPAAKTAEDARSHLGDLRFRQFAPADGSPAGSLREAQIMVRHPNNSGLQMDQVTHLYVPAFFVQSLKVWQGDELVLAMDGGISISEDPNIRFTYRPTGARTFRAEVRDTDNHIFSREWPVDGSGM